jgi:hypothetical protein
MKEIMLYKFASNGDKKKESTGALVGRAKMWSGASTITGDIYERMKNITLMHSPLVGVGADLALNLFQTMWERKIEQEAEKRFGEKKTGLFDFLFGKERQRRAFITEQKAKADVMKHIGYSAIGLASLFLSDMLGKKSQPQMQGFQHIPYLHPPGYYGYGPVSSLHSPEYMQYVNTLLQQRVHQEFEYAPPQVYVVDEGSGTMKQIGTPGVIQQKVSSDDLSLIGSFKSYLKSKFGIGKEPGALGFIRMFEGYATPELEQIVSDRYKRTFGQIGHGATGGAGILGFLLRRTPIPEKMVERKLTKGIAGIHSVIDILENVATQKMLEKQMAQEQQMGQFMQPVSPVAHLTTPTYSFVPGHLYDPSAYLQYVNMLSQQRVKYETEYIPSQITRM